ncbi:MAG: L-histidine N(alpha)-methyltransferase [Tatlockia sp.]|nr:L-histidine N(alpha)-methyltransferase [Tatlockia sp.]
MSAKFKLLAENDPIRPNEKQEFIDDVRFGLSKANKTINSKYFYDEKGSDLFNKITHNPDYYLTDCELEILDSYKKDLAYFFKNEEVNLIELGPGEGIKTRLLIDYFMNKNFSFSYYSIDISKKYLSQIVDKFNKELPTLETIALNSDYIKGVKWLSGHSKKRNFLLFLGSSIGNFTLVDTKKFLNMLHSFLHPGDYLLIGFDLLKDINILLQAYNDRDGLTREFNLNILKRMNKELGAKFTLNSFYHYGTYNIYSKAMESYLVSSKEQIVYIEALKKSYNFKEFEAIHVESSQKYSLSDVNHLASSSGFKIIHNFVDKKNYFLDSLWQV